MISIGFPIGFIVSIGCVSTKTMLPELRVQIVCSSKKSINGCGNLVFASNDEISVFSPYLHFIKYFTPFSSFLVAVEKIKTICDCCNIKATDNTENNDRLKYLPTIRWARNSSRSSCQGQSFMSSSSFHVFALKFFHFTRLYFQPIVCGISSQFHIVGRLPSTRKIKIEYDFRLCFTSFKQKQMTNDW